MSSNPVNTIEPPQIVTDLKILRKRSKEWSGTQEELDKLLLDMKMAMIENEGVGISAIQIGKPYKVFIASNIAFINPRIKSRSPYEKKDWESCLSCPGAHVRVKRATQIDVEYTNHLGVKVEATFKDFAARVIQHEFDHLHGFLIIDKGKVYQE